MEKEDRNYCSGYRDIYWIYAPPPHDGESNGKEHGTCNGNWEYVVIYWDSGFPKLAVTFRGPA